MRIVHLAYFDPDFFLWVEDDSLNNKSAAVHPYALQDKKALVCALAPVLSISPHQCIQQKIWLPSVGGIPLPSSKLLNIEISEKNVVEIRSWLVLACKVSVERLMQLLQEAEENKVLSMGLIAGIDVLYWLRVYKLSQSIVVGQKYLPSLYSASEHRGSMWEPIFENNEGDRLRSLANKMPDACRALVAKSSKSPPKVSNIEILTNAITKLVDQLVRYCLDRQQSPRNTLIKVAHDAWFRGLQSYDDEINTKLESFLGLEGQFIEWKSPLLSASSPYRFCLRLEEPTKERDSWLVRYLIHPHEEPSLLIDIREIWENNKETVALLSKYDFCYRQYIIATLGRASKVCNYISDSLRQPHPSYYELDHVAAHQFLREKAAVFKQAGLGVILPYWWSNKGANRQISLKAAVSGMKGGGMGLSEIIKFDWEIALGDNAITKEELQMLSLQKSSLVQFRGAWIDIDHAEIDKALDFFEKRESGEINLKDLIKMSMGMSSEENIPITGVSSSGWIKDVLDKLHQKQEFEMLKKPSNLNATLREYQNRGYSWLSFLSKLGLGACLADDMGLGKTIQALSLIQRDMEGGQKVPVLLVCPTTLINNWQKESARFTPNIKILVHHGQTRKRTDSSFKKHIKDFNLVITSYSLLYKDLEFFQSVHWSGIVLDEAQNIKNANAKQSRSARAINSGYKIALTGTPVENNVGDIWSIMEFLNPGFLGNKTSFKNNFFYPIHKNNCKVAIDSLQKITKPFILRRLKTDKNIIADLPDKIESKEYCTLTKEQAALYKAVVDDLSEVLRDKKTGGIEKRGKVLSALSKLKQACNHPAQFLGDKSVISDRSGKLNRLAEMVSEILNMKEKSLIFTQFAEMASILKNYLQDKFGVEVLLLHGGVSRKKRNEMIDRFAEKKGPPIFVLSLKAGGTGLNLTEANHVFHFDRWWNPAVENQATDRAFRIGQKKNVQVHKFVCAGTLEEKIDEMIERKESIAQKVVGTGEGWITELSNEALMDIIRLQKGAVQ